MACKIPKILISIKLLVKKRTTVIKLV